MKKLGIVVLVFAIVVGGAYFGFRSWMTSFTEKAIKDCKSSVPQDIYKEMNSYEKNEEGAVTDPAAIIPLLDMKDRIINCVVDEIANKFEFMGEEEKRSLKRRIEAELYYSGN
jgi:hypothetical protein